MKPITRSLVTLAALGVVGGAVAFMAYRSSDVDVIAAKEKKVKTAKQLLKVNPDDIEQLEVTKLGNVAMLRRRADSWWVESPVEVQASNSTVRTVINNLMTLQAQASFGGPDEAAPPPNSESGLDAPDSKVRIWVKGQAEPVVSIEIGDDNAFDGSVFVNVTQGGKTETYGTGRQLRSIVLKSASEFFDRRIFGEESVAFVGLRVKPRVVTDAQVEFLLGRRAQSLDETSYAAQKMPWEVLEPVRGLADSEVAQAILESLSAAPASEFLTITKGDDLSQYGLDDPDYVVTAFIRPAGYTEKEPVKRVVRISSVRQSDVGLTVNITRDDQPWVASASAVIRDGLSQTQDALRTKRLFDFDIDAVARIEMHLKKEIGDITLEKRPGKKQNEVDWMILAPEAGLAMPHKVVQMMLTWVHVVGTEREADLTLDPAKDAAVLRRTGLDDKAQTMTFLDKDGKTLGVLRIGKVDDKSLFVTADGKDFIVRVPATKLTEVPGDVNDLKTR